MLGYVVILNEMEQDPRVEVSLDLDKAITLANVWCRELEGDGYTVKVHDLKERHVKEAGIYFDATTVCGFVEVTVERRDIETGLIGKVCRCSHGEIGLVTGAKDLEWGPAYVGVNLKNGNPWSSREPEVAYDSIEEFYGFC